MDAEKLKEITNTANEAVKDLPADLRQTAFQTILNKLFEGGNSSNARQKKIKTTQPRKKTKIAKKTEANEFDELTKKLIGVIF